MKKSKISKNLQTISIENKQLIIQLQRQQKRNAKLEKLVEIYKKQIEELQQQQKVGRNVKLKNIKSDKVHMMMIDGELTAEAFNLMKEFFSPADYENVEDILSMAKTNKDSVSVEQVVARISQNRIAIFLTNQGLTAQDVANAINGYGYQITAAYVLDKINWDHDALILPDGVMVKFDFRYYEGIYTPQFVK